MALRATKSNENGHEKPEERHGAEAASGIAEVGVDAEAFPSAGEFASWCGACPGSAVSAEENYSSRCPKGNR